MTNLKKILTPLICALALAALCLALLVPSAFALTWTAQSLGTLAALSGIVHDGSQFVAVGSWGEEGKIFTSPDGVTWTERTSGTTEHLDDIAYDGSQFVAVGDSGTILTSPDGETWTAQTSGTTKDLRGVTFGNSQFVAIGDGDGDGAIFTSPDGVTWTEHTSPTSYQLWNIAYGDGLFVTVGYGSKTIYTSPDGETWTQQPPPTSETLWGVAYGDGQYVVVGWDGTILTSPDGETWTQQTSPAPSGTYLNNVGYGDGIFVVVWDGPNIMTSPDGVNWTMDLETEFGMSSLNDVAYGGGQFVAVGVAQVFISGSVSGAQLTLDKSVSPPSAKPGEAITYTIEFSNTGDTTLNGVVITDTLSASITNASYTSSGVALTQVPDSRYVWTAPDLLEGEGGVITITGVLTSPLAAGTLPNTVTLAVSGTVETADADLTVENVAPVADAGELQVVDKGVQVTLDGSGTDDNGDALTYGWTQTAGTSVTLSDPSAQAPTFTSPSSDTQLHFTLTVTDTHGATDTDEVIVVVCTTTDLTMDKSMQVTNLTAVTYTLVAQNLGPNAADGSVIVDTLSNTTDIAWMCVAAGGAVAAPSSGTGDVQVTLTAFPVNGVVTCTVSGALTDWGHVENTAEIRAHEDVADTDSSNNVATVERWQVILPLVFKNHTP